MRRVTAGTIAAKMIQLKIARNVANENSEGNAMSKRFNMSIDSQVDMSIAPVDLRPLPNPTTSGLINLDSFAKPFMPGIVRNII
jgi:hypothetical protein